MKNLVNPGFRFRNWICTVVLSLAFCGILPSLFSAESTKKVDVNTADLTTLETLPGIGPTMAQRIIDGRPYKNLSDLQRVEGMNQTRLDGIKDEISFGSTSAKTRTKKSGTSSESKSSTSSASTPVNVNTADLQTLETLPGIGPTLGQRIIDGRPYASVDDLEKVQGLSSTKINAIKDQITFGPQKTRTQTKTQTSSKTTPATTSEPSASTRSQSTQSKSATPAPTGQSSGRLAPNQKVNINTASAEELDSLFGIGPAKAQAIIDYRNEHGRFETIDDIMKVKGIKEGEFEKIRDHITVR